MKYKLKRIISYVLTFVMILGTSFGNIFAMDRGAEKEDKVVEGSFKSESKVGTSSGIKAIINYYEPEDFSFNGKVFLVGDSTACYYDQETSSRLNRQGWGMRLGDYLSEDVEVINLALSGRSSRSFLVEENYAKLQNELSEGAYLFIQFAHNDQKATTEEDIALRQTYPQLDMSTLDEEGKDTEGRYSYEWILLNKYVELAKEKGAIPVLLTPIVRRASSGGSNIGGHTTYPDAIRDLAEKYGIYCIDITDKTNTFYTEVFGEGGAEATAKLHAWKNPDTGEIDNTHLSALGAKKVASFVAEGIKEEGLTLASVIEEEGNTSSTLTVDSNFDATDAYKGLFKTVSEAVAYASTLAPSSEDDRITIEIAPGTYREQIVINTPYITLAKKQGTDGEVIITWYYGIGYVYKSVGKNGFYNPDSSTWWSDEELGQADSSVQGAIKGKPDRWGTTVNINSSAKGFRAENITFENSFNQYLTQEEIADGVKPESNKPARTDALTEKEIQSSIYRERAAAMHVRADQVEFDNCEFVSKQDTLYIDGGRVYFEDCMIEGTTDFIFGGAAALFNECTIKTNFGEGESGGYITAASTNSSQEYGYLFYNCIVTGNSNTTFGRPWGAVGGPQVTMYNTVIDHISDAGWDKMGIAANEARFYEYGSVDPEGKNIDTSARIINKVAPIGTVLNKWQVLDFNPYNYMKGTDGWDPMNVGSIYEPVQKAVESYDLSKAEGVEYNSATGQYKVKGSFELPAVPEGYEVHIASTSDFVTVEGNNVSIINPAFGSSARTAEVILYMMSTENEEVGAQREIELVLLPSQSENAGEAIKEVKFALDRTMQQLYANEKGELIVTASMNLFTSQDDFVGYTYTWESNKEEVITQKGGVVRPNFEENDAVVILTCTITDGRESIEAAYEVNVPKMQFGTWENFEGAVTGANDSGMVTWSDGKFAEGWQDKLSYGVVEKINNEIFSGQGKFYGFKQISAPGGSGSANINFDFGDVTVDNVSEFTVDFYAGNGSGKMELYFRASNNSVPIRPQFNNGTIKNITPSINYNAETWYTLKMITDATNEPVTYDFYILDSEGNILAESKDIKSSVGKELSDISYVQFRHDRNGSATEMYFDNFGFINYNDAVEADIKWIEKYLEENADSITELPKEGPRGTTISYEHVAGDKIVDTVGNLYKGTGTIKAVVSRGYLGGKNSNGYVASSEAYKVVVVKETIAKDSITIHLAGDSTVKTYKDTQFIGGWGEILQSFLDEEYVTVKNYAQGGRSSRSFINEGRIFDTGKFNTSMDPVGMGPISESIEAGDYLFIQFGHNDDASKGYSTMYDRMVPLGEPNENGIYPVTPGVKSTTSELPQAYLDALDADGLSEEAKNAAIDKALKSIAKYGDEYYAYDSGGTYKWFLKQYIDYAREVGAIPILITPVTRRYFDDNGNIKSTPGHHGGSDAYHDFTYVEAVRQLAEEEHVILIDLFKETVELYETLGEENSQYLQSLKNTTGGTIDGIWVSEYDEILENNGYTSLDGTHQNKLGAYLFGAKLVEGLLEHVEADTVVGIEGISESVQKLAKHIQTVPTSYVQIPKKFMSSLKIVVELYDNVEPIDPVLLDSDNGTGNEPGDGTDNEPGDGTNNEPGDGSDEDDEEINGGQDGGIGGSGGSGSSTPGKVETTPEKEPEVITPVEPNFIDLVEYSWAKSAVTRLAAAGIIKGVGNDKFAPQSNMRRADFMIIAANMLDLEGEGNSSFTDVNSNKYYANAVALAAQIGLATGTSNKQFNPEGSITRQDAMCIAARMLKHAGLSLTANESVLNGFKDETQISAYAIVNVAVLVELGVINGANGMINPKATITRAEVCVMMDRIYDILQQKVA